MNRRGTATVLAFLILQPVPSIAREHQQLFYDRKYYVYRESNSCALYSDYPDGMLRVAYKASTETVYLTYYSDSLSETSLDGKPFTITLITNDDPKNRLAFTASIITNGQMKGVNTSGGVEILDYLQGAKWLRILGIQMMEIARIGVVGIDVALKRLKTCGQEK
jgi:hypothetical protein